MNASNDYGVVVKMRVAVTLGFNPCGLQRQHWSNQIAMIN